MLGLGHFFIGGFLFYIIWMIWFKKYRDLGLIFFIAGGCFSLIPDIGQLRIGLGNMMHDSVVMNIFALHQILDVIDVKDTALSSFGIMVAVSSMILIVLQIDNTYRKKYKLET